MITLSKAQLRRLPKQIRGEMRSKFNVDLSGSGIAARTFEGRVYHSIAEAQYAASLELRKKCGDIREWWPQHRFSLMVNGMKICAMVVDFMVLHPNGMRECIEVKGAETDVYKLKAKLFRAIFPLERYTVVKATRSK